MSMPSPDSMTALPTRVSRLRHWSNRLLNTLLPAQCLRCSAIVETNGTLCPSCWPQVRFIDRPYCAACGLPFEFDLGEGALCGSCAQGRPLYERARAVMVYDDFSRSLVLGLKNRDRTDAVPAFARWMVRTGSELIADADLVVPVPLHWTRLFARRYNQSALLAQAIARTTGLRYLADTMVRRRRTPKLGKLSPTARAKTVHNAIAVPAGRERLVAGQRVLLVDDVYTTGATTLDCCRALLQSDAAAVDVLTLTRVVRAAP